MGFETSFGCGTGGRERRVVDGGGNNRRVRFAGSDEHGGQSQSGDSHQSGQGRGARLIEASLAPSMPTDPIFHGVAPGGAPWVLRRGAVQLNGNGRFELRVRGLVIPTAPGNGTPGPVTTVSASLYCGADTDTTAAATTAQFPIDSRGNARIRQVRRAPPRAWRRWSWCTRTATRRALHRARRLAAPAARPNPAGAARAAIVRGRPPPVKAPPCARSSQVKANAHHRSRR